MFQQEDSFQCINCEQFHRDSEDQAIYCRCPITDNCGNYLGIVYEKHIQKALLLESIGRCSIAQLVIELTKLAASNLNELKLILTLALPSQKTLFSAFFSLSPDGLRTFSQIHPGLIFDLLIRCIPNKKWELVPSLFSLLTSHPEVQINLPLLFDALLIDPENAEQQTKLIQTLYKNGFAPFLKSFLPVVKPFFPKVNIQFTPTGEITFLPIITPPIDSNFPGYQHPIELEWNLLATTGEWPVLARKLYLYSVVPQQYDKYFPVLYDKLFLSFNRMNQAYALLQRPELQQDPLFQETLKNLLGTLLFRIEDNASDPVSIARFSILARINCFNKEFIESFLKLWIRKLPISTLDDLASKQEAIRNIELFCRKINFTQRFQLDSFFRDLRESYFTSYSNAAHSSSQSTKIKLRVAVDEEGNPMRDASGNFIVQGGKVQSNIPLRNFQAKKTAEGGVSISFQAEQSASASSSATNPRDASHARLMAKLEQKKRQHQNLQTHSPASAASFPSDIDALMQSMSLANTSAPTSKAQAKKAAATAKQQTEEQQRQLELAMAAQESAQMAQAEFFWKNHALRNGLARFHNQVIDKKQQNQASQFWQQHTLEHSFSTWKAAHQHRLSAKREALQMSLCSTFKLAPYESYSPRQLITQIILFLDPIVKLKESKQIDLFVHGTILSHCVYKRSDLPEDIEILIYPTTPEAGQQVEMHLITLGFLAQASILENPTSCRYATLEKNSGKRIEVTVVTDMLNHKNQMPCDLLDLYLLILPSRTLLALGSADGKRFIPDQKHVNYFLEDARSKKYSQIQVTHRRGSPSLSEEAEQKRQKQWELWFETHGLYTP